MVMTMYGLLEGANGRRVTAEQVEQTLDGNLCRCTGYRPILDAFKGFAVGGAAAETLEDIEDLGDRCAAVGKCERMSAESQLEMVFTDDRKWYKVYTIKSLLDILSKSGTAPYMLVAGDTAHGEKIGNLKKKLSFIFLPSEGVYRRSENLKIFIDVMSVAELRSHSISGSDLVIGGNVTLTEVIEIMNRASGTVGFEYCKRLAKHVGKIANVAVRNVSWWKRAECWFIFEFFLGRNCGWKLKSETST